MQALDAYKRASGRMFPTCSEILEVIRDLGYVRIPQGMRLAADDSDLYPSPTPSDATPPAEPEA